MKMIKDNNTQEQSAQEAALPESLDHDDLEASEMESISGGAPDQTHMTLCVCPSYRFDYC
jgi:hypothetical protein